LAIPFTPIAVAALRYGVVAAIAYAAAQRARPGRIHPSAEAVMEQLPEGARVGHAPGQLNATARWRRAVRMGTQGPGMEIDLSGLARLRLRRIG
jgi:hypothetical protein